ncbi:DEAD/DEAH box helicase family protein [uncultured Desulfosarcina sp.]|uniref:DEAD/DEAH box helicase n=1 Tax=uncultured Desulfosarcina sp. TaxID=218289 RepID=UPI0029C60E15|nr:DEAD/DEAH box helicase family protein [uncultured Desulfosarcina sp.]
MSMFPEWRGDIIIPALPERRFKVGNNMVAQQPFLATKQAVEIFDSQLAGHYLVRTKLAGPFNEILLRKKRARQIETTLGVLNAPSIEKLDDISDTTDFSWDSLGDLENHAVTPENVLDSWHNKFLFTLEDEERGIPGLRTPQIGALHAISAHFSVGEKFDPATVVLPTGTGKTETMLAMQVYHQLPKTLVIVPTDALRVQIVRKFMSLGILPDAGVVPVEIARPFVARLSTGLQTVEDAQELLKRTNVIVTLPNTLQVSNDEAVAYLLENCSDLIVDEAHHVTAPKWAAIRDQFKDKRITQFTATPFRRDNKRVDGKIIFNFKLGDAQASGYYRPINLKTVEEFGDEDERDRKIAIEAISSLRRDRDELGLDHLLMARTKTTERAEKVVAIYRELAPDLKPQVVYSGSGRTQENRDALNLLLDRGEDGARIIVCVDMLGEGFDLPNLKVAALHDTHKSLAVTLQFIGRFTRKGAVGEIGEASVIANIADPETERKLSNLYAEGADWDVIIKRLSEERIEDELRLQDVVLGLKENGDLHSQLSLWNLRPSLSTQIYKTTCEDWSPENYKNVLPKDAESWYSISEEDSVLVAVVYRSETVGWGNYQNLFNTFYDLILVHWKKEEGALFIYSSDYKGLRTGKMVQEISGEKAELVSGPAIFNILNNVELPLVKNLGSSRIGAISFTSYFGPNVTDGLASIEKAESALNNIACLGYEEGERVLWGGTQRKGKVWQQTSGTISEWLNWCSRTWLKVANEDEINANITRDFLRPEKLTRPHNSWPIAVQWGEQAQIGFNDKQFIKFGEVEVPLFLVDLEISDVADDNSFTIKIFSDEYSSEYKFEISSDFSGGYRYTKILGPDVFFKKSNSVPITLEEHLVSDPFIIRYSDGTHSYNCYHIPVRLDAGMFPKDQLEIWDWDGIPLNQESMHKTGDADTIQYRAFEQIQDEYDLVFNDDGCGEAADLVAIKDMDDETIRLCLVHCKGASGARISNDIGNFYTVCGQAQKCITVKHGGMQTLYYDLKRRHETWMREGVSRFLKGDMKLLSFFKEKARKSKLEFEVLIVQPGGSAASISDDILKLLGTTELFLVKTTQAKFRVIVSD